MYLSISLTTLEPFNQHFQRKILEKNQLLFLKSISFQQIHIGRPEKYAQSFKAMIAKTTYVSMTNEVNREIHFGEI